jgi:hypothetical protein
MEAQTNSNMIFRTINVIIVMVSFIIGTYLILLRADQIIKNNAVDDCAKSSTIKKQLTTENTVVTAPSDDVFNNCLKQKGYK